MISKFSVKKPYTVFVAVIAVIVIGIVAVTKMTMDLLPNMTLPYVVVITVDPGASPAEVEQKVTAPQPEEYAVSFEEQLFNDHSRI